MRARPILSGLALPILMLAAAPAAAQIPPELQAFDEQLPGSLINDPRDIVWPTQGAALDVKGVQNADIPGGGAARRYEGRSSGPARPTFRCSRRSNAATPLPWASTPARFPQIPRMARGC